MKTKLFLLFFLLINITIYSQVKVGDNPSLIDSYSILELESTNKALVISRMSEVQMNAISPLRGALVFNTNANCVFLFDGLIWKNLCNSNIKVTTNTTPPTDNNIGDFWINDSENNLTSIWDGSNWISIDNNPRRGSGPPNAASAVNPIAGDVYVDNTKGYIYAFDGANWVNSYFTLTANNGLFIDSSNTVQLGGVLIKPTTIETNTINTLAITGLKDGNLNEDEVITVNRANGTLRKVPSSRLFNEEVSEITAFDGQVQFSPPLTIEDAKKVNVYRNGVRIDFTVINTNTIQIEPGATCYLGDQIRIIQYY